MAIAIVPMVFCILGALLYALCGGTPQSVKVSEMGRIMFAFAFLVLMFVFAHQTLRLGS